MSSASDHADTGAHDPAQVSRRRLITIGSMSFALGVTGISTARFGNALAAQNPPEGSPPAGGGPGGPPSGTPGTGGGQGGAPGGSDVLEPFVGVTADGTVVADLFPIQATGASTTRVAQAAQALLAALSDDQRAAIQFAVDDDEWRKWSNVDGYQRQGVSLRDMDDAQKAAGWALLEASLSAAGYQKVEATIKLNHTEGELMNNLEGFDEDLYWFTVMGDPAGSEPWGWQIDGHHLVINYFVLDDQVVMTPTFMGAEPTVAPEGTDYAGLSVLITEQDKGLALVTALDPDQLAKAIINPTKSGGDMQAGANSDNAVIAHAGIQATDLTDDQQTQLLDLIGEYVNNLDDEHAAVKLAEVQDHLADTWFAWIGDTGPDAVFYYRIQSPVILIEFDHQEPGPLGRASDYYQGATGPQRAHVHTIVRTPNGNDYGKDLLAEHYATSPHHAATPAASTPMAGDVDTQAAVQPLASYFWRTAAKD